MQYRIVLTDKNEIGFQTRVSNKDDWMTKTIYANIGGKRTSSISFDAFQNMRKLNDEGFIYLETITMRSEQPWSETGIDSNKANKFEEYILSCLEGAKSSITLNAKEAQNEIYRIEGMLIFARHFNIIGSMLYLALMDIVEKTKM